VGVGAMPRSCRDSQRAKAGAAVVALLVAIACPNPAMCQPETDAGRDPAMQPGDRRGAPALFRSELAAPDTLGVGRVAASVADELPAVEALTKELNQRIAGLGYARALPVIARDNAEMIEFLRDGTVDIVSQTPLSAIHFVARAGASILLGERHNGSATYSAVVFVREDSPVRTLADLRGRRMAFENRGSTAAFLLPLVALRRADIPAQLLEGPTNDVRPEAIGYFFAQSKKSIVSAVTRRAADAGAISDEDWRELRRSEPDIAAVLRPVHVSEDIPRAFVVVGPKVSGPQREALKRVLQQLEKDAASREILRRYDDVDGFDPVDDELEHQIENLEATYALVSEEMD